MHSHLLLFLFIFAHVPLLFARLPRNSLPSLPNLLSSPPPSRPSRQTFTIFHHLLRMSNLLPVLAKTRNVTILLPSNAAIYQTAHDLNCPGPPTPNRTLSCLRSNFRPLKLARLVRYHVLPNARNFDQVRQHRFVNTMSNDRMAVQGTTLIHLATAVPNPQFLFPYYNLRFQNGFAHVIDRMLLPFVSLNPEGNPCLLLKGVYFVLANGVFVVEGDIKRAVMKCKGAVLAAVKQCAARNVCRTEYARHLVGGGLMIGEVVAAGAKCLKVASVIVKCRNGPK